MIVLSSTSAARRKMLQHAGVVFKTARPPIDETPVKTKMKAAGASAAAVAEALAESKAASVGEILPGAFVIGADQMLDCDGVWFDKPTDKQAAKEQLLTLRGKTHTLITAAVITAEGKIEWRFTGRAQMTMRDFSDATLDRYLAAMGDMAVGSVGGYQLEGLGAQLFAKIEGDYFTILGLPLIPLLNGLRDLGALPS